MIRVSHESSEFKIIPPATLTSMNHKEKSSTVLHTVYSFEDGTEIEMYQTSEKYEVVSSNREYVIEDHVIKFV